MLGALIALATAGAAAPAYLSAEALGRRRWAAPLVRGTLENACVFAATAFAVVAVTAQVSLAELIAPGAGELVLATAAGAVAAVPWFAGEILSGPSAFRWEALVGAVAAAQAACGLTGSVVVGALAGGAVYVEVRGAPAVSSTIYDS